MNVTPRTYDLGTCCAEGCTRPRRANGLCWAHYDRGRNKRAISGPILPRSGDRIPGGSRTPEYQAWGAMKTRCLNPQSSSWPNYGGRGIKVCDRWMHNFPAFLEDVGPKPGPHYSLDRIDVDGDYEPGNVRWATRTEQNRNRRTLRAALRRIAELEELLVANGVAPPQWRENNHDKEEL